MNVPCSSFSSVTSFHLKHRRVAQSDNLNACFTQHNGKVIADNITVQDLDQLNDIRAHIVEGVYLQVRPQLRPPQNVDLLDIGNRVLFEDLQGFISAHV
nr:hypothetical protein [Tanacetum cinerariifolium]